ncbi:MAG TPA: 3-hydroxybenzoate 6-monooxygenase, partial [Rhodospirillaceae bacterium]|nr:3-hydroxybenzoate 6-monooxygenase [Rhodospirillaceae bacterium]
HIYHPDGAHAALRNAIMRAKSTEDWYDEIEWIYGGSGLSEAASIDPT